MKSFSLIPKFRRIWFLIWKNNFYTGSTVKICDNIFKSVRPEKLSAKSLLDFVKFPVPQAYELFLCSK